MVKNKDRIEQYLIEVGYVEQAMTKGVWLKQYDTIDCCVSLNDTAPKIEWYPHGDYSRKSVDISTQPTLIELKEIILNISKTNHMPSIFDTPKNPTDQATESPEVIPSSDGSADTTNQPGPTPLTEAPSSIQGPASSGEGEGPPVGKSALPPPSFLKKSGDTSPGVKSPPVPAPKKKKPASVAPAAAPVDTSPPVGGVPAIPEAKDITQKTHSELDRMMNDSKAERWLTDRGESYKVHGKSRPDAASIQRISNKYGVCVEIIKAVQTPDYAEAVVRVHKDDLYIDAVVHHDLVNYRRILILEMINKNPEILDYWDNEMPVLKSGSTIKDASGNIKDAKYTLMHTYFSFVQFCLRDAVTKAAAAGQAKILNQEFQDPVEIQSEQLEVDLIKSK